jgi:hypothetical protein
MDIMKKKIEETDMTIVENISVETELLVEEIKPAFTSSKTIQNGLIFYEVSFPVNEKSKLVITNRLGGIKTTIKLIDLTVAEFNNEGLLKAKLIK